MLDACEGPTASLPRLGDLLGAWAAGGVLRFAPPLPLPFTLRAAVRGLSSSSEEESLIAIASFCTAERLSTISKPGYNQSMHGETPQRTRLLLLPFDELGKYLDDVIL